MHKKTTDGRNFVRKSKTAAGNSNEKNQARAQLEIGTKNQNPQSGLSPSASRKIDTGSTLSGKRNSGSEIADFNTSAQESSGTNRPAGLRTESGRQGTGKDNLSTQIEKPQHAGRTESDEKLRAAKRILVEIWPAQRTRGKVDLNWKYETEAKI
jgi:hypothetical protein